MSCEFNGVLPAANMRQFAIGQLALTPMWIRGHNEYGQIGWQGEVIVGTVVDVQDEYDPAPDAEIVCWQTLVIEVKVAGETKPRHFNRHSYDAVPLPRAEQKA